MIASEIEDTIRIGAALELFEEKSGLDSAEFQDRYARGEFTDRTWAQVWHALMSEVSATREALAA